jgi:hypothetical protein
MRAALAAMHFGIELEVEADRDQGNDLLGK